MTTKTKPNKLTELLEKHEACDKGIKWAAQFSTPLAAWKACKNPEWMLWAIGELNLSKRHERELRLFACQCVRDTPLPDGRKVWDLLTDEGGRNAVIVAERCADGQATNEEQAAARTAAWEAAWKAAREAAWEAAWEAEWEAQADILRKLIPNPFDTCEAGHVARPT